MKKNSARAGACFFQNGEIKAEIPAGEEEYFGKYR